ncbi:MAG: E3 binding domain-containing protein, partial [Chloroflexota bacterium]
MPVPIILPKFGFTLESCEILDWLVKPGDEVREGDPLADVETDKVNMEVEATADGTVFHLMYDVGDDVPVTEVIAFLLAPGEAEPTDWSPPPQVHLNKSDSAPAPAAPPPSVPANPAPAAPAPTNGSGDVAASPVARRIADEHNVDLSGVSGSGPKGRITKQDVEAVMTQPAPANGGGPV